MSCAHDYYSLTHGRKKQSCKSQALYLATGQEGAKSCGMVQLHCIKLNRIAM